MHIAHRILLKSWIGVSLLVLLPSLAMAEPLMLDSAPKANPADTSPNGPIQLHIQKEGVPRAILFRQLQPRQYTRYEEKIVPLRDALSQTYGYLKNLNGKEPSLQRLSAFNAEVRLNWMLLEKSITPEERSYRSYRLMQEAASEMKALTDYWVTAERLRPIFRGTLREYQEDQKILKAKQETIRQALIELEKMDNVARDLQADLSY